VVALVTNGELAKEDIDVACDESQGS
jgi:hypothetical protein